MPIILGHPFLATEQALLNVQRKELNLVMNGEKLSLYVRQAMTKPLDLKMISQIDNVVDNDEWNIEELLVKEPLQAVSLNHSGTYVKQFDKVCNALVGIGSYS